MSKYKIATLAQGVGGLQNVSDLLTETHAEPFPAPYQDYTEIVGADFNGAPVRAGLPRCSWQWEWLPQADYNVLLGYLGAVYIQTTVDTGDGEYELKTYLATMIQPDAPPERQTGKRRGAVRFDFVAMEEQ